MCRSVPQTLATRTLTSTSRSPKAGTLTSSRMSAPGAAEAFTTAVIVVLAMLGFVSRSVANSRFYTSVLIVIPSEARNLLLIDEQGIPRARRRGMNQGVDLDRLSPPLCHHPLVEVLALSLGNAERLPLRAAEMFGE